MEPRQLLSAADVVVTFNEVMYNPAGASEALEFIELYNQYGVNIDVSGWRLSDGVQYTIPSGTVLAGGGYLVIAADPAALAAATGYSGALGPYSGSLSNGGERIRLTNHNGRLMDELEYNDRQPWPVAADGSGASLAKYNGLSASEPAGNWRASRQVGGTPGAINFPETQNAGPQIRSLIPAGADSTAFVPSDDFLGATWTTVGFDDSTWQTGPSGVGYDQFVLPDPPPVLSNVAIGRPVIASSGTYQFFAGFEASNVTDGSTSDVFSTGAVNSSTYWLGQEGVSTGYFIVDLGQAFDIEEIHLRNTHNTQHNDRGTGNFRILASNTIGAGNQLVGGVQILAGALSNVSGLDPIPANIFTTSNGLNTGGNNYRYLRFEALSANNPGNNIGLNEIEVYVDQGGGSNNLALGKAVIDGSGSYFNNPFNVPNAVGQDFTALNVTDGSVTDVFGDNYWLGREGVTDEYFTLDLGGLTRIEEIRFRNTHNTQYNDRGTADFDLYASTAVNASNQLIDEQLILTGTLSNVNGQTVIAADVFNAGNGLTEVTARYLRFVARTANNPGNNVGLNEIEVYGESAAAASADRYYPLDGNAIDASGNGIDGTVNGAIASAERPAAISAGQSMNFDGLDDYIEVIDGNDPAGYTLSAWVKLDQIRNGNLIVRTDGSGPTSAWSHQIRVNSAGRFEAYTFDGAVKTVVGTTAIQAGVWYHVAAVASNSGQMRLYVNGLQEGAPVAIGNLWTGGDRWRIGGNSGHTLNFFDGRIDEAAIFHSALSPELIQLLAQGDSPLALGGYNALIGNDLEADMFGVNASAYMRVPFHVANPALFDQLTLDLRYDDGAIVYLNGTEVARLNAPGMATYNSAALSDRPDAQAVRAQTLDLTGYLNLLQSGQNVLAIHGLNSSASDEDFLILPELRAREVQATGGDVTVVINETAGVTGGAFWLELYNHGASPVNLMNYSLVSSAGGQYTFGAVTLAAGQYLVLDQATLGFGAADEDTLFLMTPAQLAVVDAVNAQNTLRGRTANDPTGPTFRPNVATPGAVNSFAFNDAIVINEIMYHHRPTYSEPGVPPTFNTTTILPLTATWRYNATGTNQGTAWRNVGFNDASWSTGPGVLGFDTTPAAIPAPINTTIPLSGQTTFYFRTTFQFNGDPQTVDLQLRTLIDDGAIVYLNGVEVHREQMAAGEPNYLTLAFGGVGDAAFNGPFPISAASLVVGTNTIAVEVHQTATNSSDMIMGLEVLTSEPGDPGIPDTPFTDNDEQWIELYNRSSQPVDISGWELSEAVSHTFAPGTIIPAGGYLVVSNDAAALAAKYPGISIVGNFNGSLRNSTERLVLLDAVNNPADVVHYYDGGRWDSRADGGGSSLELRDPFADNSVAEAWAASDETGRSQWRHYSYTMTVDPIVLDPPIYFHEFVMGLLSEGELLIDNLSVIENPGGTATQLIQNGTFQGDAAGGTALKWRIQGTHRDSRVVVDPDNPTNKVLHLIAEADASYMSNHAETTLANGATVVNGRTYQISFDAKWLSGTPQLHTELYYKDAARTTILEQPTLSGTPGAPNSRLETNIGPTYQGLIHGPVVPSSTDPVTISVTATDPDGVASMTLRYSVNGGGFVSVPMTGGASGFYTGVIPPQANGAVVQFYVEGLDGHATDPASSTFPAAGPQSRALYRVIDGFTRDALRHNVDIVMLPAEAADLHVATRMMDNDRRGSTVIYNGNEVYYNVGTRLKGSMFTRQSQAVTGYNLRFNADQLFRGVHRTLGFDQNLEREVVVKHMSNAAGLGGGMYDDVFMLRTPTGVGGGPTLTSLARQENLYLDSQFNDGSDGTLYKFEGIRVMTSTVDGTPEGLKLFQPIGWVGNFDITNLGDSKELYRWPFLISNNRDRDDYGPLIEMAKAFSLSGQALQDAVSQILDLDSWMQTFAMMSLAGINDAYSQGNPHNLSFYVRPDNGRIMAFPWDWDFTFSLATDAPLHGGSNVAKVIDLPVNTRLFHGHLLHLINTVFNTTYMNPWLNHYSQMLGEGYTGFANNITQRSAFVLSQLPAQFPFEITTNGGTNFSIDDTVVTLEGRGWINVREIRLAGSDQPLNITWLDAQRWRVTLPVLLGDNVFDLRAYGFDGAPVGGDVITVTSTNSNRPVLDLLRITEINYHAQDTDEADFIELKNISSGPEAVTIDLTGVRFTAGITFDFTGSAVTTLAPGQYVLLVENLSAFEARYGTAYTHRVAGQYGGALSNGGERLLLIDADDAVVHDFIYADTWIELTDGDGHTLDIIDETAAPASWGMAESWRPSGIPHGTPGRPDPRDAALPGDANYNGVVDISDLSRLAVNFGLAAGALWYQGDFNGDGRVTITDLSALAARFGQMGGAGGAAAGSGADTHQRVDLLAEVQPAARKAVILAPLATNAGATPPNAPSTDSWRHIQSIL